MPKRTSTERRKDFQRGKLVRIDVHNHIYPKLHLDAVSKFGASAGWSIRENSRTGAPMLWGEKGYPFTITESASDPLARIRELDRAGVTMQIVSPSEPWFDFLPTRESVRLAQNFNDETSRIVEKYPERFQGLAGLPLNDIDAAIEEARRSVKELGLKGVIIPTRVESKRAISSKEFDPLFEEFDRMSLPVFIHPTLPDGAERYREYFLGMIFLYPFETTLAIGELLFRGSLERFKRMRIQVADLGGALPLTAGRMFRFYDAVDVSRKNLRRPPIEYLKKIYYENGSEFYKYSMTACYKMAGAEQILLGTNHPSPIVAFEDATRSIDEMDVSKEEKDLMRFRNANRVFSLGL